MASRCRAPLDSTKWGCSTTGGSLAARASTSSTAVHRSAPSQGIVGPRHEGSCLVTEHQFVTLPKLWSAVLLTVLLVIGPVAIMPATAAGNARATGGGTFEEENFTGEVGKSTFTFNAIQHTNGSVSGHLEYNFRGIDVTFKAKIDCLDISGNQAVIGGRISKAATIELPDGSTLEIPKGTQVVFAVADNGQGGGASPDLVSDVRVDVLFEGPDCHQPSPAPIPRVPTHPISGNIQVQA
jgi:hypothetical protein